MSAGPQVGADGGLAALGAGVEIPAAVGLAPTGADRLAGLAAWWAGVAGGAPERVERFWLPGGGPAAAGEDVVPHRLPTDATVAEALRAGTAAADAAADRGADLLLVGVGADDRDEVAWRVLAVHLLAADAVDAIGRPVDDHVDDAGWVRRVAGVRDGLRAVRGIRNRPEQLLTVLGDRALAATTALLVAAAARRTPVLLDGPAATACALLAHRTARASRYWWRATDAGSGAMHDRMLADLRLEPLTRLGLADEDGTAARIGLHLLRTALDRSGHG